MPRRLLLALIFPAGLTVMAQHPPDFEYQKDPMLLATAVDPSISVRKAEVHKSRAVVLVSRDIVRVEPEFEGKEPYLLLSGGLLIGSGHLQPGGLIDVSSLHSGTYVLHFTRVDIRVPLIR